MVIAAGHGPATYDYGLTWFLRCLEAVEALEQSDLKATSAAVRAAALDGKGWQRWLNGK